MLDAGIYGHYSFQVNSVALLLARWVYNRHRASPATEMVERMKLTPAGGDKMTTITNWVRGKFLAHRVSLMILVPLATALVAVLVWYLPLWQLSFDPSPLVDDGGPREFYPTAEELQAGAEILRASGIVERINGGQEWEPVHRVSGYTGQRGARKLSVEAKWAAPVEHSGPWSWTACDEPRKVVTHQRYSNITLLEARVDLDEGRVLEYGPSVWGDDDEQPVRGGSNPFGLVRVYDASTGRHLITGPKILILHRPILCTPGRYYRD